jgi:hypothetical protein
MAPTLQSHPGSSALDLVFDVGWQKFRAIALTIPKVDSFPMNNLYSDLNPDIFYFRRIETEGDAEIVQMPPHPPQLNPFYLNLKDNTLDLPRYSSRDITVTSKLMGLGYIAKVLISGLDMCCEIGTTQSFKAV